MIVGIVSDTHDHLDRFRLALAAFRARGASVVLHAGDIVSPFTAIPLEETGMKMIAVFGNNDGDRVYLVERFAGRAELHRGPHLFTLHGRRLALMHEPYGLDAFVRSGMLDLIVYGHLHEPALRLGPPLVINPGECGGWLSGRPTCAAVDLETLQAEIIELPVA